MEDYVLGKILHERQVDIHLIVRKAVRKSDGKEVVLKYSFGKGAYNVIFERDIYKTVGPHEGLLNAIDSFGFGKDAFCLVLEAGMIDLGSFETLFGKPDEEFLFKIKRSILSALRHLHSFNLLHCDLKPSNILLMHDGSVKLIDFGNAVSFGEKPIGMDLISAPEVLAESLTCDEKLDYWSLGVSLYRVKHGVCPFPGETKKQILRSMIEQLRQPSTDECPSMVAILDEISSTPIADNLFKHPTRFSHPLIRNLIRYDPKLRTEV